MRIISRKRLVEFWESRTDDAAIAETDLTRWHTITHGSDWPNFAGLRQTFGSADQVGNCVVFDVGNNRFRLIARVNYHKGILYVLQIMDHEEYDSSSWAEDCGCYDPPPKYPIAKKMPPTGKSTRRGRKGEMRRKRKHRP